MTIHSGACKPSVPVAEFERKHDAIDWNARERSGKALPFDHTQPPPGVRPDSFGKATGVIHTDHCLHPKGAGCAFCDEPGRVEVP